MAAQHKAAEAMYKQQASGPGAGGPGAEAGAGAAAGSTSGGGEPKGDVIDAEVVDEGKQ